MHNLVYGFHDVGPHFIEICELADSLMQLRIVAMDAVVHNTVQIKVQIIYKKFSLRIRQFLRISKVL